MMRRCKIFICHVGDCSEMKPVRMETDWDELKWIELLQFCDKYSVNQGKQQAVEWLNHNPKFELRHAHRLMLAMRFGIAEWMQPAIQFLLSASDNYFVAGDYHWLPPNEMFEINRVHASVHTHNLLLQLRVPPPVHAGNCWNNASCARDWEVSY